MIREKRFREDYLFFSKSGVPMETHGTPESYTPSQEGNHRCPRCGGLLLTQQYIDLLDDTGQIDITAWHCTICGEVLDPVILKNRYGPPPNLLYGTKERKFSQRVTALPGQPGSKPATDLGEARGSRNSREGGSPIEPS